MRELQSERQRQRDEFNERLETVEATEPTLDRDDAEDTVYAADPDTEVMPFGGDGVGMKALDHFPTMDWWAKESPGRTAIVIDDWPLQTLATKGADKSQKTLADRLLGYYRSHAPKSCDILIGTQQIFNVPTNLRRYVTCWCLMPYITPQNPGTQ